MFIDLTILLLRFRELWVATKVVTKARHRFVRISVDTSRNQRSAKINAINIIF